MAYTGDPVLMDDLLFRPVHSLIDQSLHSKMGATTTNGDGFGLGWYGEGPRPALFKCIEPAWNESNLRELATQIRTPLMFALVRPWRISTTVVTASRVAGPGTRGGRLVPTEAGSEQIGWCTPHPNPSNPDPGVSGQAVLVVATPDVDEDVRGHRVDVCGSHAAAEHPGPAEPA